MGSKARTLRPTRDQSLANFAPESVPILFPACSPPGVRLPANRVALVLTGVALPEVTHPALMACHLAPGTRNQAQGHACLILGLLDCFFHNELPTVCRDVLTSDESGLPFSPLDRSELAVSARADYGSTPRQSRTPRLPRQALMITRRCVGVRGRTTAPLQQDQRQIAHGLDASFPVRCDVPRCEAGVVRCRRYVGEVHE